MAEEETFILRLEDAQLAQRLRDALRSADDSSRPAVQLLFEDPQEGKRGRLLVGADEFPVFLKALPTVVECFKTLDDTNLVKVNDIGEVLVVPKDPGSVPPGDEWPHGVTPPMNHARARHFHKHIPADPATVSRVEQDLLAIAAGYAPHGTEFVDVEEEYVVDEHGVGSWQPLAKKEKGQEAGAAGQKKKKGTKKARDKGEADAGGQPSGAGQGHDREEI